MAKTGRLRTPLLRLIALGATLSPTIVMAASLERANFLAISFEAKYTDMPAFNLRTYCMFFVVAIAIVSIYGFLVLFLPSQSLLWRLVVALDIVFTLLITSSISAASAIARVGKKGNSSAGWLPVCSQVPGYCDQIAGALAAGFTGIIIYSLLLILYSIQTVLKSSSCSKGLDIVS